MGVRRGFAALLPGTLVLRNRLGPGPGDCDGEGGLSVGYVKGRVASVDCAYAAVGEHAVGSGGDEIGEYDDDVDDAGGVYGMLYDIEAGKGEIEPELETRDLDLNRGGF